MKLKLFGKNVWGIVCWIHRCIHAMWGLFYYYTERIFLLLWPQKPYMTTSWVFSALSLGFVLDCEEHWFFHSSDPSPVFTLHKIRCHNSPARHLLSNFGTQLHVWRCCRLSGGQQLSAEWELGSAQGPADQMRDTWNTRSVFSFVAWIANCEGHATSTEAWDGWMRYHYLGVVSTQLPQTWWVWIWSGKTLTWHHGHRSKGQE